MGSSKFYLAVGFIALMAAPLDFTGDVGASGDNKSSTKNPKPDSISTTEGNTTSSTSQPTTQSNTSQNKETVTNHAKKKKNCTDDSLICWMDEKVSLLGGVAVLLFGLLVSNMVLACCICSLRRRLSYWAITRNGIPTDVTEDRYVVGDAGLPADQAVELSTIYTMPDNTVREGNAEEAHKAEGATATEVDLANGDAQSPGQAEALLPEPPADVAEPADDVTDVLLVV